MIPFLYIACGGALGALCRYGLSEWIYSLHQGDVPWGTFVVNLIGSVVIGVVFVIVVEKELIHSDFKYFLVAGFLGAFTTYSTFSLDTFHLVQDGLLLLAACYVIGTTLTCLLGLWTGIHLTRYFL